MSRDRDGGAYLGIVALLSLAGLACVGIMLYGEWTSDRLIGSGALGALLMLFSAVVVLLRKADTAAGEE
jgi:multisubunit Na+/H+ antiporter MnhF subunit